LELEEYMSIIRSASILVLAALSTSLAAGQEPGSHKDAAVDELKSAYLSCDGAVMNGQLDTAGIRQCSIIYEELKSRAFDGDFERLLAWSRANPSRRGTGVTPAGLELPTGN
jgi:hypothetical protein